MKKKTKLLIVFVLLVSAVCALLLQIKTKDPAEQVVQSVLDDLPTNDDKAPKTFKKGGNPDLEQFLSWYAPMAKDASPEVLAVMKRFDPKFRSGRANRNEEIEQWYPTDEWIQRLLDMGISINNYSNYSAYLSNRWKFYHVENDPEEISSLKRLYGLSPDASWEEVINAGIHRGVKLDTFTDQAMAADPMVYGGSLGKDGVFIPVRLNTVYVRNGSISGGTGVPDWVPREIAAREAGRPPSREIPDDIDIIYLDEKGQAIADREPPAGGDRAQAEGFSSGAPDPFSDSARETGALPEGFDSSFPDAQPPSHPAAEGFETPQLPQSVADLETQLSPAGIEAELSEGVNPDALIDPPGAEEALRRMRDVDPEAARRFERGQSSAPNRSVPKANAYSADQPPADSP